MSSRCHDTPFEVSLQIAFGVTKRPAHGSLEMHASSRRIVGLAPPLRRVLAASLSPLTRTSMEGSRLMSARVPSISPRSSGATDAQIRQSQIASVECRVALERLDARARRADDSGRRRLQCQPSSRRQIDCQRGQRGCVTSAGSSRYSMASRGALTRAIGRGAGSPAARAGRLRKIRRPVRAANDVDGAVPTDTSSKAISPKNTRYEAVATTLVGHEERLSVADGRHPDVGETDVARSEVVVEALCFDLDSLAERGPDGETGGQRTGLAACERRAHRQRRATARRDRR